MPQSYYINRIIISRLAIKQRTTITPPHSHEILCKDVVKEIPMLRYFFTLGFLGATQTKCSSMRKHSK